MNTKTWTAQTDDFDIHVSNGWDWDGNTEEKIVINGKTEHHFTGGAIEDTKVRMGLSFAKEIQGKLVEVRVGSAWHFFGMACKILIDGSKYDEIELSGLQNNIVFMNSPKSSLENKSTYRMNLLSAGIPEKNFFWNVFDLFMEKDSFQAFDSSFDKSVSENNCASTDQIIFVFGLCSVMGKYPAVQSEFLKRIKGKNLGFEIIGKEMEDLITTNFHPMGALFEAEWKYQRNTGESLPKGWENEVAAIGYAILREIAFGEMDKIQYPEQVAQVVVGVLAQQQ